MAMIEKTFYSGVEKPSWRQVAHENRSESFDRSSERVAGVAISKRKVHDHKANEDTVGQEKNRKSYRGFAHWSHIDIDGIQEIYFSIFPFAVTVVLHRREFGYLTDWWVSGTSLELKQPRLVLRLGVALLAETNEELESEVKFIWLHNLRDMATDCLALEGFAATGFRSSFDYTKFSRERILRYHLLQHDKNWEEHDSLEKRSKVLLTAGWHNLAKQFGISQTQKLIATHEATLGIIDFIEALPNRGRDADELKTSHINQRLKLAKDEGLVERKER